MLGKLLKYVNISVFKFINFFLSYDNILILNEIKYINL